MPITTILPSELCPDIEQCESNSMCPVLNTICKCPSEQVVECQEALPGSRYVRYVEYRFKSIGADHRIVMDELHKIQYNQLHWITKLDRWLISQMDQLYEYLKRC